MANQAKVFALTAEDRVGGGPLPSAQPELTQRLFFLEEELAKERGSHQATKAYQVLILSVKDDAQAAQERTAAIQRKASRRAAQTEMATELRDIYRSRDAAREEANARLADEARAASNSLAVDQNALRHVIRSRGWMAGGGEFGAKPAQPLPDVPVTYATRRVTRGPPTAVASPAALAGSYGWGSMIAASRQAVEASIGTEGEAMSMSEMLDESHAEACRERRRCSYCGAPTPVEQLVEHEFLCRQQADRSSDKVNLARGGHRPNGGMPAQHQARMDPAWEREMQAGGALLGSPPRCRYCQELVRGVGVSQERHEQACLASITALEQAGATPGGYFTVASRPPP